MKPQQRKIVRLLFDEYHSESWSISRERAAQMQPENPAASSYELAANLLGERDFFVQRNLDKPLSPQTLSSTDVLILIHPCDSKWEKTTSSFPPALAKEELQAVRDFVQNGGGLLLISEYEHEKYNNNLNELLQGSGLSFENTTVSDSSHCHHDNPTWIYGEPVDGVSHGFSYRVNQSCFYRSGSCQASNPANIIWKAHPEAKPSSAGLIAAAEWGKGRVMIVADSSLFGDRHIQEFDHRQLWLNLIYWCSTPAFKNIPVIKPPSSAAESSHWQNLKKAVNELRLLEKPDGTVDSSNHVGASEKVSTVLRELGGIKKFFPHQEEYLKKIMVDLEAWMKGGFQKPDFTQSLAEFNPELNRKDHIEHLVLFPMYTPNASKDTRFEALIVSMPWPDWLSKLESESYQNDKFAPGHLVDFTEGYNSECAVLFPETVSISGKATNNFSTIFCDREARRLQSYSQKAVKIVNLELHPHLEVFINSLSIIQDTTALWDLIHDKSHSLGELPFDPFMIRQKAPFWMYGLEELRVDLRSYMESTRLAEEGFPFAHYVTYAILFDRIFRFPITGPRIRNYDALGGQLLFSYLHQKDILLWSDNRLTIKWNKLLEGVSHLRDEITQLYKHGADYSKLSFWIEAHNLVSQYVRPNVASKWKKDSITDENDPKKWISLVHDDEFPLGNFHTHLLNKMQKM
jgi:hypothetical protein